MVTRESPHDQSTAAQPPAVHGVHGPRQQAWIRALERARLVATRKPTYHVATDTFSVYSARQANTYTVTPSIALDQNITYRCTCQAGQHDQVCWHAALVAALPGECERRRTWRSVRDRQREAIATSGGTYASYAEMVAATTAEHDAQITAASQAHIDRLRAARAAQNARLDASERQAAEAAAEQVEEAEAAALAWALAR